MKPTKKNIKIVITTLVVAIIGRSIQVQIESLLSGYYNQHRNPTADMIRRPRTSRNARRGFREDGTWFDCDHVLSLDC